MMFLRRLGIVLLLMLIAGLAGFSGIYSLKVIGDKQYVSKGGKLENRQREAKPVVVEAEVPNWESGFDAKNIHYEELGK